MDTAWIFDLDEPLLNLRSVNLPADLHGLDEISAHLPGGAYTTLRTFPGGRVLQMKEHLYRLEHTAELAGKPVRLDHVRLRAALRQVVQHFPAGQNLRLRLTLDLDARVGDIYITAQALVTPALQDYQNGVRVMTCSLQRWLPKAKLTRFIARADQVRHNLPPGVHEAVMLDPQGRFLEGLSSNFFAGLDGEIWTAEEGVLSGITRALTLESAARLNVPVQLQPACLDQLPEFTEVFITSASRAILPVTQIDETVIADERPGPITRRLMNAYAALVEERLEDI